CGRPSGSENSLGPHPPKCPCQIGRLAALKQHNYYQEQTHDDVNDCYQDNHTGLTSKAFLILPCGLFPVLYAPNDLGAVIGNEQRSIRGRYNANRFTPEVPVGIETSQEIFIDACGLALLDRDSDHLVARAFGMIPGSMLGREGVARVFGWEHL